MKSISLVPRYFLIRIESAEWYKTYDNEIDDKESQSGKKW